MTARPWRAVASLRPGPGLPALVLGRAAAKTRGGLDAFCARYDDYATVQVWEVRPIPEVAQLTQVADSPAG